MNRRFLGFFLFEWLVFSICLIVLSQLLWPKSFDAMVSSLLAPIGAGKGLKTYLYITGYLVLCAPIVICAYALVARLGSSLKALAAKFLFCSSVVLLLVFLGVIATSL